MGHSMGGWVTAVTAAQDPDLAGVVLISAGDMTALRDAPAARRLKVAEDNHESLAATTQEMADELATLTTDQGFAAAAPGLARKPLLVLTADDGLAAPAEMLAANVRNRAGAQVTSVHVTTDHSWNDARIRLETEVLNWLAALPK